MNRDEKIYSQCHFVPMHSVNLLSRNPVRDGCALGSVGVWLSENEPPLTKMRRKALALNYL